MSPPRRARARCRARGAPTIRRPRRFSMCSDMSTRILWSSPSNRKPRQRLAQPGLAGAAGHVHAVAVHHLDQRRAVDADQRATLQGPDAACRQHQGQPCRFGHRLSRRRTDARSQRVVQSKRDLQQSVQDLPRHGIGDVGRRPLHDPVLDARDGGRSCRMSSGFQVTGLSLHCPAADKDKCGQPTPVSRPRVELVLHRCGTEAPPAAIDRLPVNTSKAGAGLIAAAPCVAGVAAAARPLGRSAVQRDRARRQNQRLAASVAAA